MIDLALAFERASVWIISAAVILAVSMTCAVIVGRIALAWHEAQRRRVEQRYGPLARRALDGDQGALRALVSSPSRQRLAIARLLLVPLITDRRSRVASLRRARSCGRCRRRADRGPLADRGPVVAESLVVAARHRPAGPRAAPGHEPHRQGRGRARRSERGRAGRRTGRARGHAGSRGAAGHRGASPRRVAAARAAGRRHHGVRIRGETFLLELARVDPEHRLGYAHALAICGTGGVATHPVRVDRRQARDGAGGGVRSARARRTRRRRRVSGPRTGWTAAMSPCGRWPRVRSTGGPAPATPHRIWDGISTTRGRSRCARPTRCDRWATPGASSSRPMPSRTGSWPAPWRARCCGRQPGQW